MSSMRLKPEKLRNYLLAVQKKSLSEQEIRNKLKSVDKFLKWALAKNLIKQNDYEQLISLLADLETTLKDSPEKLGLVSSDLNYEKSSGVVGKLDSKVKELTYGIGNWLNCILLLLPFTPKSEIKSGDKSFPSKKEQSNFGLQYYLGVAIVLILLSAIGGSAYDQFFRKAETSLAFPTDVKRAGRIISFQGRLTDSLGNPITTATNARFKFYNASTSGSTLHDSSTCSVTPDQDGIFDVLIGGSGYSPTPPQQVCGTELPASLFTENSNVYLGVTVGGDSEMSPRQQIANVGYAMNAETLQGLPPGAGTSNIPIINKDGDLLVSVATPGIRSTYSSATFTLSSAGGVNLQSGGSGDVTLNASQSGSILFATGGSNRGTIDNSGNVGIGTTSPSDLLHLVGGQMRIDNNSDTTDKGCVRYNGSSNELQFSNDCSSFQSFAGASSAGGWTDDGTVVRLTTSTDNVTLGSTSDLAKLGIDGESDEIQFIVQGNSTQTNNLVVFENSSGTDQFRVDNSGNVAVEGGISDISGNLVLNDAVDIGSATTGVNVTTAGAISDSDGNLSLNDNTDITGDLSVSGGDITGAGGASIDIGETTAGDVEITGDLLPATDDTYDLGSTTKSWQDLYLTGQLCFDDSDCITSNTGAGPWDVTAGVVHLDTSTNNVTIGGSSNLAKLAVDGDTDEIQFLVQGNSTQTTSLAVLENSSGTDQLTVSNTGDLAVEGTISDIGGNLVLDDTVDIGSATTGLRVATTGSVSDIDGNIVLNDSTDIGSATTGINVTTVGLITDIDGNVVIDDTVDLGSATTGINITTGGVISDSDGNVVIGDTVDLGSATTGINVTTTGVISDTDGNVVIADVVDLGSATTGLNVTTAGLISDSDGSVIVGDDFQVNGNTTLGDSNSADTLTGNLLTSTITSGATTQTAASLSGTGFTTGEILDLTGTWQASDGSDNEGVDANFTYTPTSTTGTFRGIDLSVAEGANALANTLYGVKVTSDNSANTSTGTHSIYGGHFTATGKTAGTTTAVGLYATATGADNNYAAVFESGNVGIGDTTPDAPLDVVGDVYISDGLSLFETAVSDGTVEATQFCTGDGETNCVTDFNGGNVGPWNETTGVIHLDTSTNNVTIGSSSNLAKLAVDGDTDEIQLLIQGNATQTSPLATFEQSDGTDVLTISNGGASTLVGTISDIGGNLVLDDTVDIGSSTTGLNVTTGGVITDTDGNIVLDDVVDIGSATTGINVTTAGLISDSDGSVIVGDDFQVNGNTQLGDTNTADTLTGTLLTSAFTSGATTQTAFSQTAASLTTGEVLDITATSAPADGSTNEAIDLNITHTPTSSSDNFRSIDLDTSDGTALGNTVYGIDNTLTLTGNAAKTGIGMYSTVTSSSTTADTLAALDLASSVTGIIATGTRSVYGLRTQPTAGAESTGGTTNVYGVYTGVSADVAAGGAVNGYGVYIANGTFDTDGTSSNIGLYVESPTGADTNYAAIFAGGNVGIGDTAPTAPLDVTGDIYLSSGISTFQTAVSDGTVEATTFCTGDGETNCTSDFGALASSGSGWVDDGTEVRLNTSTDEVEIGSAGVLAAKLAINGDADEIQFLVQGNATQTSSLAVFEQSDGTDVLTISNGGALTLEGTVSDIGGNLVLDDTVDIGSATTGINVTTAGVITDSDGNVVIGDTVDLGSATTGLNVTTGGVITDTDGNIVLDDVVD